MKPGDLQRQWFRDDDEGLDDWVPPEHYDGTERELDDEFPPVRVPGERRPPVRAA